MTSVAWLVILATSFLPTVLAQEVLGASVTLWERTAAAAGVVAVAFLVTLVVAPLRALRPLLTVLLTLVGSQWLVFGVLAQAEPIRRLMG